MSDFTERRVFQQLATDGRLLPDETEVMVVGYTTLVDCIDSEGRQVLALAVSPHTTMTQALGYAQAMLMRTDAYVAEGWDL